MKSYLPGNNPETASRRYLIKGDYRECSFVRRVSVRIKTGKMRHIYTDRGLMFRYPVNFLHQPLNIIQMLEYLLGNNPFESIALKRKSMVIQVADYIGFRINADIHPNATRSFIFPTA